MGEKLYRSVKFVPERTRKLRKHKVVPERVPERVFFTYSGLYAQRLILLFNIILILDAPVHAPVQLYVIMMMI